LKLWLARHSEAGGPDRDPVEERERELTEEGEAIAEDVARGMKKAGEIPEVIFASNYRRASQTGDIFGKILGCDVDLIDECNPHMPLCEFIQTILADENSKRVMIVGHSDNMIPALEELGVDETDDFAKGEVRRYKIDRDSGKSKERWRLRPSDVGKYEDDFGN
jgi:phosphohistidine phosphatase SixA